MRVVRILTLFSWAALCLAIPASTQVPSSTEQVLEAGRDAIQQQRYTEAIRLLEEGLKRYPEDQSLKVELGRAYLYNRQDEQAMRLFQEVLQKDPSNRVAKLELARALAYHPDYETSDRLYRELLASNPDDEAASLGLIRNLVHQKRIAEARSVCGVALSRHPDSHKLQEYKEQLNKGWLKNAVPQTERKEPHPAGLRRPGKLQAGTAYFSDSGGNRSWRLTQEFEHQIAPRLAARLRIEERSLWNSAGPKANVGWGTGEMRAQLTRSLLLSGGGGSVRFADGSSRALYRGEVELHPARGLWLTGGYARRPISPTNLSAQYDLVAAGWHTRLDWYPRTWRLNSSWSRENYSDGNRDQRLETQLLRWAGDTNFSLGAGYRFNYLAFDQSFPHGYFNPSRYYSHLGEAGVKFRLGKAFRAEYLGGAGVESISGGPYHTAWELALRNRAQLGNWELGGDYYYFHLAQNTGAFRSQGIRMTVAYYF
jgi:hypothetical protein